MEEQRTLVIKLGYRGAHFSGFAAQPGQRTVAGEITLALETILRCPIDLTCAGRTDAGVHAQAQYVSIPLPKDIDITSQRLMRALNALTSDDIAILDLLEAPCGFSARFDAQMRHYTYRIVDGPQRPVLTWDSVWHYPIKLDINLMQEGANYLIGEHDFKSFCKAQSALGKPTCRFVKEIAISRQQDMEEHLIHIDVYGNAFLHSMVRTITGTLVEVGRAHRDPRWVAEVLAAQKREAAGPCAPAQGLVFAGVDYPEGIFKPWE